jgi:hypothetical protein
MLGHYCDCCGARYDSKYPERYHSKYPERSPTITIIARSSHMLVWSSKPLRALESWREIPGRRWDARLRANIIPLSSKRNLWDFLKSYYPGEPGVGPKGTFIIPGIPRYWSSF